jgi:hypothetical protein
LQLGPRPSGQDTTVVHDPGLMASFMRGFSLSSTEDEPAESRRADGDD